MRFVLIVLAFVVATFVALGASEQAVGAAPRPCTALIPHPVTVKHVRARLDQRRNLTIALNVADRMHAPIRHRVALIAAMTQESSATNLDHGTGSSVGVLQLINTHGLVSWRMGVANSAGWFLRGAHKIDPTGKFPPGKLAQAVERSGHPSAYKQWVPEAWHTLGRYRVRCSRPRR